MTKAQPQNWPKVKTLFNDVLEMDSSARSAFLRDNCPDVEVRAEVERLLAEYDQAGGFLSRPALYDFPVDALSADSVRSTVSIDSGETAGTVIGRYHLVQKIGEGGMGEVWQAEQKEPIRRPVALKLIKAGMNTREVIRRFESERQALALMDHPAIAKVLDAGSTPQGAPYFVMEYVAAAPITAYCDNHRLSIQERLELFLHVCDGVQHAHQKAIIHRDLKPSNILVTEVDGQAAPKIIDFGVAKALGQRLTAETMYTHVGVLVGTPEYMSPEQSKSSGEDIDTRTDVYSLGVIFYELLAGGPPIDLRKIAFEEFLRRLREQQPTKPSTRIRTSDQATSTEVARKRQSDPLALAKQMHGELDSIALKALEKERSRRYSSPSDFAADIKRYLNNEAVLAVLPSPAYRARKFARRHRTALVTACAFALVLIVAAVVNIRQSIRAEREAAVAEAVNEFLQNDLLAQASASGQSGPNTKPDPDLKVRTALDRAAARIEGKFTKQPEVEASIRDTMGEAYIDLGLYPEARKQLERALELRRRVLGAEDAKTFKSMERLGWLAYLQGRYAEAETLNRQALEDQRRVLGPGNPDTVASISNLATVYRDEGKYAEAEELDVQTLEMTKRALGPEHPTTLRSMDTLAVVYFDEGKRAQAESLVAQTLEIRKQVMGPEHPQTLGSMNSLARIYEGEGKYTQAEALVAQTLEIEKRVLGPEHPSTLRTMDNLANTYQAEGKYAQAEGLSTQALEVERRVLGPENPLTLNGIMILAQVYIHEGKYGQAERLETQALEIEKRVLGPEHPLTAGTLYDAACLAARRGDKDRALALLSQSLNGLSPSDDLAMEQDPDLFSLHGDPRFAAVVAQAKQVAKDKQKAAAPQAAK